MICPNCGASAPDNALWCPRCRYRFDDTRKISLSGASWCPHCGALVAPGAKTCQKCGSTITSGDSRRAVRDLDIPDIGNTGTMQALRERGEGPAAGIESAIPPEGDAESRSALHDRTPRPKYFAIAALFAVAIVGGATLLIAHPWDPTATQTKAQQPADTSMSGYPGLVESLTGQDVESGEQAEAADPYDAVLDAYNSVVELSGEVDKSEALLRSTGLSGSAEERAKGRDDHEALSIKVSNLISSFDSLSDWGGVYAEDIANISTLASWLRNRCDLLSEAWDISAGSSDPSQDVSSILSLANGSKDYARHFEDSVGEWKPSRVS